MLLGCGWIVLQNQKAHDSLLPASGAKESVLREVEGGHQAIIALVLLFLALE